MRILFLIIILNFSTTVHAAPPQEAITACKNARTGTKCNLNTPRGILHGTCQKPPHELQMICIPGRAKQSNMKNSAPHRKTRKHRVNQSDGSIKTIEANTMHEMDAHISIRIEGAHRILKSNGIAKHMTGAFPNHGNPHSITEQDYYFRIPAKPKLAETVTPLGMHSFGLGINGIPFDPGAAEWYLGQRNSKWQYEAMSGAITLGLDKNHAHVQPTGAYHYHGLPTLLLSDSNVIETEHSPIIGWAADGFPIYALYGYDSDENIAEMKSGYQLREGERPSSRGNPGGHYDGTFTADYEYVTGSGNLDECNGRMTKTPDFPEGTYAYFLTQSWPIVPRCYKGTPSKDFTQQKMR